MSGKMLSVALGALPEDLVAEALEPAAKSRAPWLRLAACFAVIVGLFFGIAPAEDDIVTAPGILTVEVRAVDDTNKDGFVSIPLQTGVTPSNHSWSIAQSFLPGLPIYFDLDSEEFPFETIRFTVIAEAGVYIDWDGNRRKELPSQFELPNSSWVYWLPELDLSYMDEEYEHVYSSIVIYCQDYIVGYAVLRFDRLENKGLTYSVTLVESVCFPKQNGNYQNVPYEYVLERIKDVVQ